MLMPPFGQLGFSSFDLLFGHDAGKTVAGMTSIWVALRCGQTDPLVPDREIVTRAGEFRHDSTAAHNGMVPLSDAFSPRHRPSI